MNILYFFFDYFSYDYDLYDSPVYDRYSDYDSVLVKADLNRNKREYKRTKDDNHISTTNYEALEKIYQEIVNEDIIRSNNITLKYYSVDQVFFKVNNN